MPWSQLEQTVGGLVLWGVLLGGGILCSPDVARTEAALRQLRDQPVRKVGDPAEGPGWYRGQLVGPPGTSPLGTPAVLWVIQGFDNSGEDSHHICSVQQTAELELAAEGQRVKLVVPPDLWHNWLLKRVQDATQSKKDIQWIPPECRERPGLTYYEVAIPAGTPVWVSGCFHTDTIGPCDSGYDGLSTGSRAALVSDVALRASGRYLRHPLWGLFMLFLSFGAAATQLRTPSPRRKDGA